jgi:hypothetical protein
MVRYRFSVRARKPVLARPLSVRPSASTHVSFARIGSIVVEFAMPASVGAMALVLVRTSILGRLSGFTYVRLMSMPARSVRYFGSESGGFGGNDGESARADAGIDGRPASATPAADVRTKSRLLIPLREPSPIGVTGPLVLARNKSEVSAHIGLSSRVRNLC